MICYYLDVRPQCFAIMVGVVKLYNPVITMVQSQLNPQRTNEQTTQLICYVLIVTTAFFWILS